MTTIIGTIICYIVLLCLLIAINRRNSAILSVKQTALAFAMKVIAGCVYGYLFLHYYNGDDTWYFHNESIAEYEKLISHPVQFFKDLLPVNFVPGSVKGWQAVSFYQMELEKWIMVKPLAVFNIFSRGNYYVNVVFFNFFVFWGHYWLFRLFDSEFPGKRTVFYITIFVAPSVLFWLSGIRADGWLLFFTALLFLQFSKWIKSRRMRNIAWCLVSIVFILILREVLLLLILPALIAWYIAASFKKDAIRTFGMVYLVCLTIFFGSTLISADRNFATIIVNRQQAFMQLEGKTRFPLDSLRPTLSSFISVLPQAVNNAFIRPYPWEAKDKLQIAASADVVLFTLLLLLCIYFNWRNKPISKLNHPFLLAIFAFSLSLYILIGYTVPFPGAIVRYKIIAQLLLTSVFASAIPWKDLFKLK